MASLWNGCAAEQGPALRTKHDLINEGARPIEGNRWPHFTHHTRRTHSPLAGIRFGSRDVCSLG